MKHIRDALVIGSGIIGTATAFALTRLGNLRVTLLEKGPLVSGMTRRSAGMAHPFHSHPLLCDLAMASYSFYNQWALHLGGKNGFMETGAVAVVASHTELVQSQLKFGMWKERASSSNEIAPGALAELFPSVAGDLDPAMFSPHGGYADAVLTAQAMVNAATERGLEVKTGTQVRQIVVEQGYVKGVKTTTGDVEAPTVVVTAGGWSERLLTPLGVVLQLRFRRGTLLFYEQPREKSHELPIVLDASGEYFMRPHPYHMAAGGSVERESQVRSVETLDETVSSMESSDVNRFMGRCIPGLAMVPPKRSHSILYESPADGLPALGPVPSVRGLYIGAGFGASAFAVAPAVGEILAQLIVDGQAGQDISSFSPVRSPLRNL